MMGVKMPKEVMIKNVPAGEVDQLIEAFKELGGTDTKKEKQPDGTFNLWAFLPGDDDFPTDIETGKK
jgi:hypothetical protein